MKISDYAKAQGWLKRHAASENSVGEWKKYVALNTTPELDIAIQTIDDKFGPGTVFPASEAPIPPKTDQQAIFEFGQRNPKAGGGRIGFKDAKLVGNRLGAYTDESMDTISDAILKSYANDDISLLFEKSKEVEASSLLGYYASIKFKNYSTDKIELFSVGSEIFESSK